MSARTEPVDVLDATAIEDKKEFDKPEFLYRAIDKLKEAVGGPVTLAPAVPATAVSAPAIKDGQVTPSLCNHTFLDPQCESCFSQWTQGKGRQMPAGAAAAYAQKQQQKANTVAASMSSSFLGLGNAPPAPPRVIHTPEQADAAQAADEVATRELFKNDAATMAAVNEFLTHIKTCRDPARFQNPAVRVICSRSGASGAGGAAAPHAASTVPSSSEAPAPPPSGVWGAPAPLPAPLPAPPCEHSLVATRAFSANTLVFEEQVIFNSPRFSQLEVYSTAEDLRTQNNRHATENALTMLHQCLKGTMRKETLHSLWNFPIPESRMTLNDTDVETRKLLDEYAHDFNMSNADLWTMMEMLLLNVRTTASYISKVSKSQVIAPLSARVNHSCEPNVMLFHTQFDRCVAVYALRDIAKGETLTCSRVPEYMLEDQVYALKVAVGETPKPPLKEENGETPKPPVSAGAGAPEGSPHAKQIKTILVPARSFYLEKSMHERCFCARCVLESKRLETRAIDSKFQSPLDRVLLSNAKAKKHGPLRADQEVCSLKILSMLQNAKEDFATDPDGQPMDNLYKYVSDMMLGFMDVGIINERIMGVAPLRWDIARRFAPSSGFFAWSEAYEFLRACTWGGGELALHFNYDREAVIHTIRRENVNTEIARLNLLLRAGMISGKEHTQKTMKLHANHGDMMNPQPRKQAIRINTLMLKFMTEAVRILLDRTFHRFKDSPASPLARVLALAMVACIYGLSPTLERSSPISAEYQAHMYEYRVLVRETLQAEHERLFQAEMPALITILLWFDERMEHIARERSNPLALIEEGEGTA